MDEIKSLITRKHTTNGPLEKPQNLSPQPSKRQAVIIALMQQTQARRALPLISVGYELQNALRPWEDALKNVPEEYLARAYEHAADNWPWTEGRPFTGDAVADAYKILVVEDRQREEAAKRNAQRRDDTYRCWHCCDVGYQQVFIHTAKRWYSSQRPCSCEAAPMYQRSPAPLEQDMFVRNKLGQYAQRSEIEKHGAPNDAFKEFISSR